MVIVEVVKTRIGIDVTHVTEKFLYAGQCDAVTYGLAEDGCHIVDA
jgi:hypothetical protein